jgi:hypothetical protein
MDAEPEKIPDPELRRFAAAENEKEARSVIVELGMEQLLPATTEKLPRPRIPPRIGRESFDRIVAAEDTSGMSRLESELNSLGLSHDLVRLNTARSFVATVSPQQLRAISSLPLVGIIRPNRTHRIPAT